MQLMTAVHFSRPAVHYNESWDGTGIDCPELWLMQLMTAVHFVLSRRSLE